jgi:hypothetical protein
MGFPAKGSSFLFAVIWPKGESQACSCISLFASMPFCLYAFMPFCLYAFLPLCLMIASLTTFYIIFVG